MVLRRRVHHLVSLAAGVQMRFAWYRAGMNPSLDLAVSADEGSQTATVVAIGEIELAASNALLNCLEQALADAKHLRLDLGGVTFIDSTGLSVLLQVKVHAERRGGTMRIVESSPAVDHLIGLAQIRDHLL